MASQEPENKSQSQTDKEDKRNSVPSSKESANSVLSSKESANSALSSKESANSALSSKESANSVLCSLPPLAQLTDRFGNTFHFGNAGDYWHPTYPIGANSDYRTHVQNIRNFEIRPDDIFIFSYPKTGFHWTAEIVSMLMKNKVEHTPDGHTGACFLDFFPISKIDCAPSPRLICTHVPFRHLPKQLFQKTNKIILLDRNPKDVIVSYYNHWHMRKHPMNYPGTFEHFFQLYFEVGFYYGDFFDYMMEGQNGLQANPKLDVFIGVFEDMKFDPIEGVKKINKYLGTCCSDELCEDIAVACSFKNLKEFKDMTLPEFLKSINRFSGDSLYRKGEVGDWKNWFTVAMNEKFDEEYSKRMKDYKTEYKFTLP